MSLYFINEWFTFDGVIDKKTCDRIKSLGEGNWQGAEVSPRGSHEYTKEERVKGVATTDVEFGIKKPEYRNSEVHWTTEQWLYDLIWPYMEEANEVSGWKLAVMSAEVLQVTRYKKGEYYNWHKDGPSDSLSAYDNPANSFIDGKVRKISFSLILNDDFEGGDFEFCSYEAGESMITPIKAKRGDMIFFPSGMEHRVRPVTKGTRYSLVGWFVGPPIK
jgi:PKHD-type hydroxylase